jgi:hypothetical protein
MVVQVPRWLREAVQQKLQQHGQTAAMIRMVVPAERFEIVVLDKNNKEREMTREGRKVGERQCARVRV